MGVRLTNMPETLYLGSIYFHLHTDTHCTTRGSGRALSHELSRRHTETLIKADELQIFK